MINYIDLFAGAGGLSEGFTATGFHPISHIEMNKEACNTLRTRACYYYLKSIGNLNVYKDYLKGVITREKLYSLVPASITNTVINQTMSEETDVNRFVSFATVSLEQLLSAVYKAHNLSVEEIDNLDCYIDTKEFIDEKIVRKLFPNNWKEEVRKKYPEFFDVIKKEKYTMKKAPPYDAEVILGDFWPHMRVNLGKTFWFNHCWNYSLNLDEKFDRQESYTRIINLVSGILSNSLCMVYIFADHDDAGELIIPSNEIEKMTPNDIMEYLEKSGLQKRPVKNCSIEIRIQYWDSQKDIKYKFVQY